jgi:hypothetical protein
MIHQQDGHIVLVESVVFERTHADPFLFWLGFAFMAVASDHPQPISRLRHREMLCCLADHTGRV